MDLRFGQFVHDANAPLSLAAVLVGASARQMISPTATLAARLADGGKTEPRPGGAAFNAAAAAALRNWQEE